MLLPLGEGRLVSPGGSGRAGRSGCRGGSRRSGGSGWSGGSGCSGGSGSGRVGRVVGVRRHQPCSPHSVLARPAQRPARASSPARTRRVQGAQPTEA
ncbi:hypothetical protein DDQ41_26415 [Streptomyces spongiicola]|uniref:Uncharacterized protein n=1 Tax=Streptomyces spongiicola TaxID=1690221 RepID=A0ABN5KY06_9ACTN|nr:hypothetical protein DDQ41_26415 [Streptomyces spongiicola]